MRASASPAQDGLRLDFFQPHPHLDDEINRNICQSEMEGGVFLDDLPVGAVLEMETRNRLYDLENRGGCQVLIAGHPEFCPEPVLVDVHGSTWGRSMLKIGFVGRGMCLEFRHPAHGVILTSPIREIRERRQATPMKTGRWSSSRPSCSPPTLRSPETS